MLRLLGDAAHREESAAICAALVRFATGTVVAAFFPLRSEPDIGTVLDQLAEHDRLALPLLEGDQLRFRHVADLTQVQAGPHGFRAPPAHFPKATPTVAIIPGLAFGRDGSRLGRGRGHYDRFLAEHPSILRIGVGFSMNIHATVPHGTHDARMDVVVSGAEIVSLPAR